MKQKNNNEHEYRIKSEVSNMVSCSSLIAPLIMSGDLHTARFAALNYCLQQQDESSSWNNQHCHHHHLYVSKRGTVECAQAWSQNVHELLAGGDEALAKIDASHRRLGIANSPPITATSATSARDNIDFDLPTWEKCCRRIVFPPRGSPPQQSREEEGSVVACGPESPGCVLSVRSEATLLLPLINELLIRIELPPPVDRVLTLEQDGILQPYDVATILWPGGYLLTLFINDFFLPSQHRDHPHNDNNRNALPRSLPLPIRTVLDEWLEPFQNRDRPLSILELGAGIGSPSIAAALAAAAVHVNATIVATDKSRASLALATANAAINVVHTTSSNRSSLLDTNSNFRTHPLDFASHASRTELLATTTTANTSGFGLVLGAALEFEVWEEDFFGALEELTHDGGLVILVHVTGGIGKPPLSSCFTELGRVSGAFFGMCSMYHEEGHGDGRQSGRQDELESCFEILLWRKNETQRGELVSDIILQPEKGNPAVN